jgi:hypothetical protein
MSGLGFLTESALLPKKAKPIKVDASSVRSFALPFLAPSLLNTTPYFPDVRLESDGVPERAGDEK